MYVFWQAEEAACCHSEPAGLPGPPCLLTEAWAGMSTLYPTVSGSSVSLVIAPRAW